MSLPSVLKQVRALSYSDMMTLAADLSARLSEYKPNEQTPHNVAAVLSSITTSDLALADTVMAQQEDKILRAIFSRKRQMNIVNQKNGWLLEIPTIQGSQVVGTDLRAMFPMAIDQIVTLHVLSKP